jgi:hypothetical protein
VARAEEPHPCRDPPSGATLAPGSAIGRPAAPGSAVEVARARGSVRRGQARPQWLAMSQSRAGDRSACTAGELRPHGKPSSTAGEEAAKLWRAEGRGAAPPRHAREGARREGEPPPGLATCGRASTKEKERVA